MRPLLRVAVGLALLAGLLVSRADSQPPPLRVGYIEFPPLAYSEEDAETHGPGLFVELYRRALERLDVAADLRLYPPSRVRRLLADGQLDLFLCAAPQLEGLRETYLASPPILTMEGTLFQRSDLPEITSVEELRDATIVAGLGIEAFASRFEEGNRLERAPFASAVEMFRRGRVDYLLDYRDRVEARLGGSEDHRSYVVGVVTTHLCLSRAVPDAGRLVGDLWSELVESQREPDVRALFDRYDVRTRLGPEPSGNPD